MPARSRCFSTALRHRQHEWKAKAALGHRQRSLINQSSELTPGSDIAEPPFLTCLSSLGPLGMVTAWKRVGSSRNSPGKWFLPRMQLHISSPSQPHPCCPGSPGAQGCPSQLLPRPHITHPVVQRRVTFYLGCFTGAGRKDTTQCFPNALKPYSFHPYFSSPAVEHSECPSLCLGRP